MKNAKTPAITAAAAAMMMHCHNWICNRAPPFLSSLILCCLKWCKLKRRSNGKAAMPREHRWCGIRYFSFFSSVLQDSRQLHAQQDRENLWNLSANGIWWKDKTEVNRRIYKKHLVHSDTYCIVKPFLCQENCNTFFRKRWQNGYKNERDTDFSCGYILDKVFSQCYDDGNIWNAEKRKSLFLKHREREPVS